MAEVFPHYRSFFSILAILKRRGVKFEPKVLILGPSLFHKHSNTLKRFSVFLFARLLPLVRISAMFDHTGGVKAQKPPKKDYFLDAELVRKILEILS